MHRKTLWLLLAGLALLGGSVLAWAHLHIPTDQTNAQHTSKASGTTSANFNKQEYSLTSPTSVWVVVNKLRPLDPKSYAPPVTTPSIALRLSSGADEMHVSTAVVSSLERLFAAAKSDGVSLRLASGYRPYTLQVNVYGAEVKNYGQAKADQESARPGYSEHQTGLAVDVEPLNRKCEIAQCFSILPEGKWLAANAFKYGFIIRYPAGKQGITGYEYEPWHVRFVGPELANELHNTGTATLEEFFGLPAAPHY